MDRIEVIVKNVQHIMGCNGLRYLRDLGNMRQETVEKRLGAAQQKLTIRNTVSIYTAWLWEKAFSMPPAKLYVVMEKWCMYLWQIGCTRDAALQAWSVAITTSALFAPNDSVFRSAPMHVNINAFIMRQYPTTPPTKPVPVAPEGGTKAEGLKRSFDEKPLPFSAPLPPPKKQKAAAEPSMSKKASKSKPFAIYQRDMTALSPRRKGLRASTRQATESSAMAAKEDARRRDMPPYGFDAYRQRPSAGGSHWSPRQDAARYGRGVARDERPPTPIKFEDGRSPTPPPRAPTSKSKSSAVSMDPQMQMQSWQFTKVQHQLMQQAKRPAAQPVNAFAGNSSYGTFWTSSFGGQMDFESTAGRMSILDSQPNPDAENWYQDERGRLSP